VDLSDLLAAPLDPRSTQLEPHLPVSCGYNSSQSKWYKIGTYLESASIFRNQGRSSLSLSFEKHEKIPGEINLWQALKNPAGEESYRAGGRLGDARFVPLSSDVYLQVFEEKGVPFYWGLILVPSKAQYQLRACKKAHWLACNADLVTAPDRAASHQEIRQLLMRGEALERARKPTLRLKDAGEDLPVATRARLETQVHELFDVIDGKAGNLN
jgi:hypothetical protein